MMRRPDSSVLRRRDFRLLFCGQTVSLIGDGIVPIALAFAILELTNSATDVGIVFAARSLVVVALVVAGGVFADRISPRRAMLWADLARLVVMSLIAALLIAGVAETWQLAVLYAIEGMATALFNPASNALLPSVVPKTELQGANALLSLSKSAGKVAGPALGGLLLALGTPGFALAADAVTFGVSAAFLLRLSAAPMHTVTTSFVHELRDGWIEFSSRTWLWVCVLAAGISNAIFFPCFQVLGPTVANGSLGGSSAWALIVVAFGGGALAGGALALSVRPRRQLLVAEAVLMLTAVPLLLLAVGVGEAVIAVGAVIGGGALSVTEILYETATQQHIPTRLMARVSAYDWFGSLALQPIGFVLIGPLAASLGNSSVLVGGACALIFFQCLVLLVPSVWHLRAQADADWTVPPPAPISAGD